MRAPLSRSPEEISRGYNSWIVVRRWAATGVDFLLFYGILMLSVRFLPKCAVGVVLPAESLFIVAYYVVLEGLTGWTIGKFFVGLHVVNKAGNPPGLRKAFIRTLLRLVEVNPVLAGGLPAGIIVLLSEKRQRIGDMLADTYVIKTTDLWPE